jgi:hypothetical protein
MKGTHMDFKDNIFSANHRTAMMARYGYTAALDIKVDDLAFEATMDAEYEKNRVSKRGEPRR